MKHHTFVDYATQGYAALVVLLILFFHNGTVPHWQWLLAANAAVIIAAQFLVTLHSRAKPGKLLDFLRNFYPVLLYTFFFCETGWLNRMFFKDYLDPVVIRCEQSLFGCQPGLIFMEKLPHLAVSEMFYAAYFSYYIMIVGVGIALFVRNREQFSHYLSVISFVFYVCYTIYIFLPVIGPRVFWEEIGGFILPPDIQKMAGPVTFPENVKSGVFFQLMAWIYRVFEAPGAAFPSSHVAIALCTLYFSFSYLKKIRWVHLALVILLCLATMYCHYHYGLDVITGALTAAVLVPLGNWLYRKTNPTLPKEEAGRIQSAPVEGAQAP